MRQQTSFRHQDRLSTLLKEEFIAGINNGGKVAMAVESISEEYRRNICGEDTANNRW